jgi:hypothetical protein
VAPTTSAHARAPAVAAAVSRFEAGTRSTVKGSA